MDGARVDPGSMTALGRTLARLLEAAPAIGVTRLAVLTGLDGIGMPVAAAIRPNSRTVTVHQGKGPTLAQAKVSAMMEALECHCAETQMLPLRLGTAADMAAFGRVVDPSALPRRAGGPDPVEMPLLWVEGTDLSDGAPCWVPREVVAADFVAPAPPGSGVFQATTNGMGAGVTREQAVLHGLCEAIERDALALWHARSPRERAARLVDPASVGGTASRDLLDRMARAGLRVGIAEATSDIGVPVFIAVLGADGDERLPPELGSACHPDPDRALAAALAEAAQARLTWISGARDDFAPAEYDRARIAARAAAACPFLERPTRHFRAAAIGLADGVAGVRAALARVGLGQVAVVDLTQPVPGLPVARVVVPGLEGPWTGAEGEYCPGARARGVAR